ncbi:MAG: hypothetical protein ACQEP9_03020 [Bacillota bacterium]
MKILDRDPSIEEVKKNYAQVIGFYDLWSKLTETKALNKIVDLAEIGNDERILEVAVGTATCLKKLLRLILKGKIRGLIYLLQCLIKQEKD